VVVFATGGLSTIDVHWGDPSSAGLLMVLSLSDGCGHERRFSVGVVGCLYSVQYKSIFGVPDKVRRDMCDKARPLSQI
jgi:hypothetical protein